MQDATDSRLQFNDRLDSENVHNLYRKRKWDARLSLNGSDTGASPAQAADIYLGYQFSDDFDCGQAWAGRAAPGTSGRAKRCGVAAIDYRARTDRHSLKAKAPPVAQSADVGGTVLTCRYRRVIMALN